MALRDPEPSNLALSDVVVLAGSANPALGAAIARELGLTLSGCTVERFPDGEIHVEVDARGIEGRDVFILEPTSPGVPETNTVDVPKATSTGASDHLLELLFIADASHRSGALSVSALVPYFGYARQDRRKKPGEALGARVIADVLGTARFERIVAVDLHSDVVEASLDVPVESLTAVPLLAEALKNAMEHDSVVVAPDFGAVRLAREYSRLLHLPLAVVHKVRASGTQVDVERVAGDVRGLHPVLVDDMIATGGTIVASARALRAAGARGEMVVAATHPVLTPGTVDRLREVGVRRLVVTNTIPLQVREPAIEIVSVAPLLAACVRRIAMRRHVAPPRS
jgi:ribose-phosphate pyrophosphokinase